MVSPALKQELQQALQGCAEIVVFLKQGAQRFAGTRGAFLRSCVVTLLMVPVAVLVFPLIGEEAERPYILVLIENLVFTILATAIYLGIMYLCRSHDISREQFIRFATGYNWLSVPLVVTQMPFLLLGFFGLNTWGDVQALMILVTLYAYAYLGYLIVRTLNVAWYVGIAFSILALVINEFVSNITDALF